MENKTRTEIATLGEFALIERLCTDFAPINSSTIKGSGDDAAVIGTSDTRCMLISSDMLLEGINFDLTYFPLTHLGYKTVVVGISDILAMNAKPTQITIALGISNKFSVEMLEDFYSGVRAACMEYGVDMVGGDTTASLNGFTISVSAVGEADRDKIAYRSGAKENDLICISGATGGAYMGLHLLERERRAFEGMHDPQPKFEGQEYILSRQLKPSARLDVIQRLAENGVVPSAMIDISDGIASELLHICKESQVGARLYLDRLPIAKQTYAMAEEMGIDPVVAALNGGEDYELLFTVPLERKDEVFAMGFDVIGHITRAAAGTALVTPDGGEITITAQGWK